MRIQHPALLNPSPLPCIFIYASDLPTPTFETFVLPLPKEGKNMERLWPFHWVSQEYILQYKTGSGKLGLDDLVDVMTCKWLGIQVKSMVDTNQKKASTRWLWTVFAWGLMNPSRSWHSTSQYVPKREIPLSVSPWVMPPGNLWLPSHSISPLFIALLPWMKRP